jgi:DNA ligase D-like protein (predicted ligase)
MVACTMTEAPDLLEPASVAALRPATDADFREPMLATLIDRRLPDRGWLFERKLDGVRAIVTRDGGRPHLWSRNHKPMDATYPELVDELAERGPRRFVADGEIVAFDGDQTSFAKLQPRMHLTRPADVARVDVPVFLYLFDLLVLDDVDVSLVPLRDRKKLLRIAFDFGGALRFSEHRETDGDAFFQEACANGWEGLIAKRAASPYRPGRAPDWLKLKCVREQEFVVGGWTDPAGTRVGFGALLLGYYDGDRLRYAGKVGTGYDRATLLSLRAKLDSLAKRECPFDDTVSERGAHWVRPELVAQIGFGEWTPDGRLRHPRFLGLRNDKDPREVVREDPDNRQTAAHRSAE